MHLVTWKNFGWLVLTIILPTLISVFGPEIRQFLIVLRGKPHEWLLAHRKDKLRRLERLHNSAYNLLLHFLWNITYVGQVMLGYALALAWIRVYHPDFNASILISTGGIAFGRLIGLSSTVYDLYDYDKVTTRLKEKIAKMEGKTKIAEA